MRVEGCKILHTRPSFVQTMEGNKIFLVCVCVFLKQLQSSSPTAPSLPPTSPCVDVCSPGPPWTVAGWRCRWGWGRSSWCSSRPACRCQVYRWGSWPGRLARPPCSCRTCSLKTRRARWTRRRRCPTAWPPASRSGSLKVEEERERERDDWLEREERLKRKKRGEPRAAPLPLTSPGRGFLVVSGGSRETEKTDYRLKKLRFENWINVEPWINLPYPKKNGWL